MKHIPMRMCAVTRVKRPKVEMVRFAIDPLTGHMVLDRSGKVRSRGVNLVKDLKTYDEGIKRGSFERALGKKIDQKNYEEVRDDLEKLIKREKLKNEGKGVSLRVKGSNINLD